MLIDRFSLARVVLPPRASTVGAVTAAVLKSKVPPPINATTVPVKSSVPPLTEVLHGSVIVPPVLVMEPLVNVGAADNVRLFAPVMICSAALSKVTALVTVRLVVARVKARLFRVRVVTVMVPAPVKVVLAVIVRLEGAVKVVPVRLRFPARFKILPVMLNVPPLIEVLAGRLIVPPLLVMIPFVKVGVVDKVRSAEPVSISSEPLSKVTALDTVKSLVAEPKVRSRLFRFKVGMITAASKISVADPPKLNIDPVVVSVPPVFVSVPVNEKVLPVTFSTPGFDIEPPAERVIVPPVLVISPSLSVKAEAKVRSLAPVMIRSAALSIITALATVRLDAERVRA